MTNFLLDPTQQEKQQHWLLEQLRRKTPSTTTKTVWQLAHRTKLDLGQLGLTELPVCLPAICPHLRILFCPENNFVELPAVIGQCKNLSMVSFKNCGTITSIHPEALQAQLRWCIVTGNQLTAVPTTLGRCTKLQKLMLSGNRLQDLPAVSLPQLELLRVACNAFPSTSTAVASIVTFLQSCPKLNWVSFAGNPFVQEIRRNSSSSISSHDNNEEEGPGPQFPIFDDPTLEAETWPILGRGASGIIRKVPWTKNNNNHNNKDDREEERREVVAVKTFVGTLTSDGSPHDEKDMAKLVAFSPSSSSRSTTTSTTTDPALIHIYGETKRTGALVMEYLPGYTALASPPDFETCTRDVYDHHHHSSSRSNRRSRPPTAAFCWQIAMDTLRVVTKLHADLGISHGDLYAHNILIRSPPSSSATAADAAASSVVTTTTTQCSTTNAVKVSDFGAAYRYKSSTTQDDEVDIDEFQTLQRSFAQLVEQIELRAYAVLVEELYALVQIAATQQQQTQQKDEAVHHTSTVANIITPRPISTIQHPWKELLQACSEQPSTTGTAPTGTTATVTTATPTTVTFRTLAQQFLAV